jgi:hypothetical protein
MERPRIWTGTAHGYVSVIGLSLCRPLLRLLEDLEGLTTSPSTEVQASNPENGLSAAVVVLAVTLVESALNRTRYVRRNRPKRAESSCNYFLRVTREIDLAAELEEAIAVRDAIVHNHIWWALVGDGPDGHPKFWGRPRLRKGYGDGRFRRVRKRGTRVTRRLGLNLFPSRIDRRDARVAVKTVSKCLHALESKKREYFPIQDYHFEFGGKDLTFYKIADSLPS